MDRNLVTNNTHVQAFYSKKALTGPVSAELLSHCNSTKLDAHRYAGRNALSVLTFTVALTALTESLSGGNLYITTSYLGALTTAH